jgi:hypothetical protein
MIGLEGEELAGDLKFSSMNSPRVWWLGTASVSSCRLVFEVGEEWVGVGVLGLLFLDFWPGAGDEEGRGMDGCCVRGFRST